MHLVTYESVPKSVFEIVDDEAVTIFAAGYTPNVAGSFPKSLWER
jgi:hypothetical protein